MAKLLTWRNACLALVVGIFVYALVKSGMLDKYLPPNDPAWGRFSGNPRTEWLPDGRKMRLLEEFNYTDPRSKTWVAPQGWTIDGASIPQAFWTLTGGPLEGPYRNASICHDVECDRQTERWEDVHLMFYEAMRCGGVSENRAKTMYAAVYLFGPRWEHEIKMHRVFTTGPGGEKNAKMVEMKVAVPTKGTDEPSAEVRDKIQSYIEQKNPTLEDIQKLDPKDFGFPKPS